MSVLTRQPDAGASMSCEPTVETAKFGDGYEQRVAIGINNKLRTWSVQFTYNQQEVLDLLESCGGVTSFTWTDPLGQNGQYLCRKWRTSHIGSSLYSVSGDFEQVVV